jgi:large subunit ribosomal protein L23
MNPYILKQPVITEKSVGLAQAENKYTFEVDRLANKDQIRQAIEELYSVNVVNISTIRGHRVSKATGRKRMKVTVAPNKKAVVTLRKGQKIDVYEFGTEENA